MNKNTRVLVLKDMDYREKDKIVTLLAENDGKMAAVARGVKKPSSSMRGCVQPFCYSELQLHRGKGELGTITQGKILDFFGRARLDLDRTLLCMHMMELLDKSLPDRQPEPEIFRLALGILELMDGESYTPLWIRYFELAVIKTLGVAPVLERCVHCGGPAAKAAYLDLELGGLLCPDCRRPRAQCLRFQAESLAIMGTLLGWDSRRVAGLQRIKISEGAGEELESNLEKYLEFHLEKNLSVKKSIKHLQGNK